MGTLAWIAGIIGALGFLMTGAMKLMGHEMVADTMGRLTVTDQMTKGIGAAEVAGGLGLFIGLLSDGGEFVGFLAAIGLIGLLIGALIHHQRVGDPPKEMVPALVMMLIVILYLIGIMGN